MRRERPTPGRAAPARVAGALGVLVGCLPLTGCGGGLEAGGPGDSASVRMAGPCPEGGAPLTSETTFVGREGTYRLTLIDSTEVDAEASDTAAAGRTAGALILEPTPAGLQEVSLAGAPPMADVSIPLFGWTDIEAAAVGATAAGEVTSRDPARPGVSVVEDHSREEGPPRVVLRLGAQANDRSRTAFDQAYLALHVEWLAADGTFGGRWSSGGLGGRAGARGIFCAVPTPT